MGTITFARHSLANFTNLTLLYFLEQVAISWFVKSHCYCTFSKSIRPWQPLQWMGPMCPELAVDSEDVCGLHGSCVIFEPFEAARRPCCAYHWLPLFRERRDTHNGSVMGRGGGRVLVKQTLWEIDTSLVKRVTWLTSIRSPSIQFLKTPPPQGRVRSPLSCPCPISY
jgi:hypothetical protein